MSMWEALKRHKDKDKKTMYCLDCGDQLSKDDIYTFNVGTNNHDDLYLIVSSKCCHEAVGYLKTNTIVKGDML